MKLILNYSAVSGDQRQEVIELSANDFTIGGTALHTISLPGLGKSLDIKLSISDELLSFSATDDLTIDKASTREGEWRISQRLTCKDHCLTLVGLNKDEIIIDVSLFSDGDYLQRINPFQLDHQTSLAKRPVTYILLALVLTLGFLMPLAYHFFIKGGGNAENWHGPTDEYWTSGPLANAHQYRDIDGNCQACHSDLWVQTQDKNCLQCHQNINGHADYNPHINIGQKEPQCASCHKEHSRQGDIINYDSAGCINCHAEPELWSKNHQNLASVTAFSRDDHPQFNIRLLVQDNNIWQDERILFNADLVESSNLKFSHKLHLNGEQVDRQGMALQCVDCHVLTSDNEHFVPVSMDQHCIDCHTLGIDVEDAERQLPHAKPRVVVKALEEFMSYQYLNPKLRANRDEVNVRTRAIPGKPMIKSSFQMDPCKNLDSIFDCVSDEVEELAEIQFEKAGCITCHEVTQTNNESVYERWLVKPIKLQDDWYANHKFNHTAHLTGDFENNDLACLSCHAASVSDSAENILIPGQENCLGCHGDSTSNKLTVEMNCLNCHEFHRPHQPAMTGVGADTLHSKIIEITQ